MLEETEEEVVVEEEEEAGEEAEKEEEEGALLQKMLEAEEQGVKLQVDLEEVEEEEEEEHGNWESSDPSTFWQPDNNEEEQELRELDNETKGGEFFASQNHVEHDQTGEIVDRLMPMIEKMIKEYCSEAIDKIAWEVIPDLAENLIKSELKSLKEEREVSLLLDRNGDMTEILFSIDN